MISFEKFLEDNGITVVNGMIKIELASKVPALEAKYRLKKAKEDGLPKRFSTYADKIVDVKFYHMICEDQDPTKFECLLIGGVNHEHNDTWDGAVRGTVQQVWDWAIAESGLDPLEIEDSIHEALLISAAYLEDEDENEEEDDDEEERKRRKRNEIRGIG